MTAIKNLTGETTHLLSGIEHQARINIPLSEIISVDTETRIIQLRLLKSDNPALYTVTLEEADKTPTKQQEYAEIIRQATGDSLQVAENVAKRILANRSAESIEDVAKVWEQLNKETQTAIAKEFMGSGLYHLNRTLVLMEHLAQTVNQLTH